MDVFPTPFEKKRFIWLLQEKIKRYKIRLLAFCVMDNHYHLVLQNTSGKLSEFFRSLNSQFAAWFQWRRSGHGYVFQGRFHSTLIQDGNYLETAILYVLSNPVRAGIVSRCEHYPFSSASLYGKQQPHAWLDSDFVLGLFGDSRQLFQGASRFTDSDLSPLKTPFGPVMGDSDFLKVAIERFDRRKSPDPIQHRRRDDFHVLPVEQVVQDFERSRGVNLHAIDKSTHKGKRLRAELLVCLRDQACLSFKEISELDLFADLQYKSLSQLYSNAKKKLRNL